MAAHGTIRYGVVGLGHIAQVAVIPAFAHARRNSQLVAIVSSDRTKRREVARRYRIEHTFTYRGLRRVSPRRRRGLHCAAELHARRIRDPSSPRRCPCAV